MCTYVSMAFETVSMHALETICTCDQVSTHVAAISSLARLSAVTVHSIAQRAQRSRPGLATSYQRHSVVTGLGATLPCHMHMFA